MALDLDNIAVAWPRTGRFYEPVSPEEFHDFPQLVVDAPDYAGPALALAGHIAKTATVHVSPYTQLVDLLLGLDGVLYATEASVVDEDPVIDPEGCEWIAGGLEKFIQGHQPFGQIVTFDTVAEVMRRALSQSRQSDKELRWLDTQLDAARDEHGNLPVWNYSLLELSVLAAFYRRCAQRSFAVYADADY
jgi:hypothetical protein